MKARLCSILIFTAVISGLGAQAVRPVLKVGSEDIRIEERGDGGYHLFIRAKPGLGSVLLTETTKDPAMKADNYAYRAKDWNPINGDERRILDGAFIDPAKKLWSLVDSTPEADASFGSAFHVFIPYVVEYGYAWSRHGEVFLCDGTFINVRAFASPYADYRGGFMDNPYLLRLTQVSFARPKPPAPAPVPAPEPIVAPAPPEPEPSPRAAPPPPEPPAPAVEPPPPKPEPVPDLSLFIKDTVDSFRQIAKAGGGETLYSEGEGDIVAKLGRLLDSVRGKSLDIVICLDSTESMKDDIEAIKRSLPDMLASRAGEFESVRLGFVLYKDYFEDYLTKRFDFTSDFGSFTLNLASVRVAGGRDIPEAVYEALYEALSTYAWAAEEKMIVLIGDAPPHPLPRGKIDRFMVEALASRLGVEMDVIILPH